MITVVCHNWVSHITDVIHTWNDDVKPEEIRAFIAYETAQDHCSEHVYYEKRDQ